MNGKIYCITNLLDGKRYFGQTINVNPYKRWVQHKWCTNQKFNKPLYNAINNYGVNNFEFKVIIENIENQKELDRLEIVWIKNCYTNERNQGYNLELGGNSKGKITEDIKKNISVGVKRAQSSPEVRLKMSNACKGRIPWNKGKTNMYSESTINKMSQVRIGKTAWNKGIPHPPEVRAKMGANKGKILSPETRAKMSDSHKGKIHTPEARAKMSASLKGKILSPETRAKMSDSHKGKKNV